MKSGLIIFNTLAVMLRTDDAGHWTQDTGRRTHDIVLPTTLYYKLTGELKTLRRQKYFRVNTFANAMQVGVPFVQNMKDCLNSLS